MLVVIFDMLSLLIGITLPAYNTWKLLQQRKTTVLVPLARYWTVFGFLAAIDSFLYLFYVSYLIPCYAFWRFLCLVYVSSVGYNHVFDKIIDPLFKHNETALARWAFGVSRILLENAKTMMKNAVIYAISLAQESVQVPRVSAETNVRIIEVVDEEELDNDEDHVFENPNECGAARDTVVNNEDHLPAAQQKVETPDPEKENDVIVDVQVLPVRRPRGRPKKRLFPFVKAKATEI